MHIEVNPSKNYQDGITLVLTKISKFYKNKPFSEMNRQDIIKFLDSYRKSDGIDTMHKWIGTYNNYLVTLTRFFKWLYNPTTGPKQRTKPEVVQNIHALKRKEQSIYKPTDLWTKEDDLLFLRHCPNVRDRCYHTISRDLSARPHEILSLRIKDIVFKNSGNRQYAECLANGKTGTRQLPLIDSLPYVKDWLDQHPRRNTQKSYLICSLDRKNFGGRMTRHGIMNIYRRYRDHYFPKLLENTDLSIEEKQKIVELLKKPWNPYIRRHSALTEKSKFLRENTLRQHAGWSGRSQMHLKYLHYFGNESNNSILQEYGIVPKDNEEINVLKTKQCTNCNEPNRPDQKFCVNCKMALTFEAYTEKDDHLVSLEKQIDRLQKDMRILMHADKRKARLIHNPELEHKVKMRKAKR